MIQAILASNVPGRRLRVAARRPGRERGHLPRVRESRGGDGAVTNLGAATPVQIGSSPAEPPAGRRPARRQATRARMTAGPAGARQRARAQGGQRAPVTLRSLAELRGRNPSGPKPRCARARACRRARRSSRVSSTSSRTTCRCSRRWTTRACHPGHDAAHRVSMREVEQDWRTRLLSLITNLNVAYLLMLIGIYGLLLEGYNPARCCRAWSARQPAARAVAHSGPVRQLRRSRADCARRAAHHAESFAPRWDAGRRYRLVRDRLRHAARRRRAGVRHCVRR